MITLSKFDDMEAGCALSLITCQAQLTMSSFIASLEEQSETHDGDTELSYTGICSHTPFWYSILDSHEP